MAQLNNLIVTGVARFLNKIHGDIDGDSATVNSHTVEKDVPSNAVFTDTQSDWNASSGLAQILNKPTLGTAAAKDYTTSVSSGSTDLVTSGAVHTAITNLPEPMVMKGTLGTGGTITSLPTASASNEGYTYKVITDGTYASQSAKVGDLFVSYNPSGSTYDWLRIPSGDETTSDTWRNIKVNGTEKLGNAISTGAVDFVNGTGTTVGFNATGSKVSVNVTYGSDANTACQGNDSRLSDARTPTSHTHGNIQNNGTLQTTDITVASGDKLVVTDSSDSNKVARTSVSFDGSTTNKALTPKGTFENFVQHSADIQPLIHKTYASTSYYASANNWEGATWYFMSIKPDNWYKPFKVKLKIHSYCPSYATHESYTWTLLTGRNTSITYANWNERYNSAHSYLTYYPLTQTGFNAGYGHAIGISIYNADNRATAAYYRTFEIDYYECENCTVEFLDTPVKWANWTGTGTTNYGSLGSFNAVDRGLQETGDANTVTENRIGYFSGKTGAVGVWATGLFMEDANGTYQSICTASDGTVTDANRTTGTKIANTHGFKFGSSIWYVNTTYNANTNISGQNVVYSAVSIFDTRYAFNTTRATGSLTPYSPIYLVGSVNHLDGLFYLDQTWWTQTPNDTNKIYVLVGGAFDSTSDNVRATLYEQNKWFQYDGSKLVEIGLHCIDAETVGGMPVETPVPADAVFTDMNVTQYTKTSGTYPLIFAGSNNDIVNTTGVYKCPHFQADLGSGILTIALSHNQTTCYDTGLVCGNNIPEGTAGSARGFMRLYAKNGNESEIFPAENSAYRAYFLPVVDANSTLATTNISFPCYAGLTVSTLDEFVALLNKGNQRSFSGTVKTTVDIGIGTVAGEWTRVIMMSQNVPNNGSYDLGLFAMMLPHESTADIKYALITGMSTGNYTVAQYGVINRDFGVDGNLYLHGRKVLNNVTNASLYIASSSDTQYAVWLGKTGQLWTFCPNGDDKLYLGLSSYRWKQIYSTTATISTSDRNQKKDIKPLDESARDFIMSLNPVSYKMKDGDSGRTHHGMIAQDVEEEMAKLGMTPMDFAGFCKDQKTETYEVQTEDGQIERKQRVIDGEYIYGLRYEEFIPSAIKTIQLQQKEINELRNELAEIKAMLNGGK